MAPHNTTQFISENYSLCTRTECMSSTTTEEEWNGQKEDFGNAHCTMIGKNFLFHLLGLVSLRELEKQESLVLGRGQSGVWISQAATNDCDLPADCFLPIEDLTKGMGSVKSSLLIEAKKNDEVLELPTLDIDANSHSEPRSGQQ